MSHRYPVTNHLQLTNKDIQVLFEGAEKLTPCSPGDQGAMEMSWVNVDADQLLEPPLVLKDFVKSVRSSRPTISHEDLKRNAEWTEEFGSEGAWRISFLFSLFLLVLITRFRVDELHDWLPISLVFAWISCFLVHLFSPHPLLFHLECLLVLNVKKRYVRLARRRRCVALRIPSCLSIIFLVMNLAGIGTYLVWNQKFEYVSSNSTQ